MNEQEKQVGTTIASAIADLPYEKKQYFVGYAEGLKAMAEQVKEKADAQENK